MKNHGPEMLRIAVISFRQLARHIIGQGGKGDELCQIVIDEERKKALGGK